MTEPTPAQILHARTGASPDECERAIADASGDPERAFALLYERTLARRVHPTQAGKAIGTQLAKTPAGSARGDLVRKLLGADPYRALDVAAAIPRAVRFEGPTPHRRAVVVDTIAVLTDASGGDTTPVLVMTVPSAEQARSTASNWVGIPAEPISLGKPTRSRARKSAAAASATATPTTSASDAIAPALSKQIARLAGTAPADTTARKTVSTAVGERTLSPAVTAFAAVTWPTDRRLVHGDPEATITFGGTPLIEHLASGHDGPLYAIAYDELQFYLVVRADDMEADPRVYRIDHDGSTPLHSARLLSQFLAKVKSQSTAPATGVGPQLLEAIRELDAPRAIELVKAAGTKALVPFDKAGFTPLHYAAMAGLTDVVAALLAAGADPNAQLTSSMKFGKKLRGDKWGASREPQSGETALHEALFEDPKPVRVTRDVLGVVRALVAAGADVNHADRFERTPLLLATQLPRAQDEVVRVLLAAGADPHGGDPAKSALGNAMIASLDRTRAMLAAGADPNRVTKMTLWEIEGATPIHMAARWNLPDELEALLDAGGDPNVRAGDGSRAIAHARPRTLEILRARGAIE